MILCTTHCHRMRGTCFTTSATHHWKNTHCHWWPLTASRKTLVAHVPRRCGVLSVSVGHYDTLTVLLWCAGCWSTADVSAESGTWHGSHATDAVELLARIVFLCILLT